MQKVLESPVIKIVTLLKHQGRTVLWIYTAVILYLSLGLVGYGLAWNEFGRTSAGVLVSGGAVIEGRIARIWTSGFGSNKDYFIRLDTSPLELMLPASVVNPRWDSKPPPFLDLGSEVGSGDPVSIRTTGGKPVVLELILRRKGEPERTVLNYGISAQRYQDTLAHAPELAKKYLMIAEIFFLVLGGMPWIIRKRLLR